MTDVPETSSSSADGKAPAGDARARAEGQPAPRPPARRAPKPRAKRSLLIRQKRLNRVLLATAPVIPASVCFFGWRAMALVVFSRMVRR